MGLGPAAAAGLVAASAAPLSNSKPALAAAAARERNFIPSMESSLLKSTIGLEIVFEKECLEEPASFLPVLLGTRKPWGEEEGERRRGDYEGIWKGKVGVSNEKLFNCLQQRTIGPFHEQFNDGSESLRLDSFQAAIHHDDNAALRL